MLAKVAVSFSRFRAVCGRLLSLEPAEVPMLSVLDTLGCAVVCGVSLSSLVRGCDVVERSK